MTQTQPEATQPMDKATFLARLKQGRAEWDTLMAEVTHLDEARMLEPGAAGHWSVKDVIAHIAWGEREMIGVIRDHALAGSPLWQVSQTERNEAVYQQNRDRPLAEVIADERDAYGQVLTAVSNLEDADFTDASRYAQMPPEWGPWQVFAGNTYEHYEEHIPLLRDWLAQQQGA